MAVIFAAASAVEAKTPAFLTIHSRITESVSKSLLSESRNVLSSRLSDDTTIPALDLRGGGETEEENEEDDDEEEEDTNDDEEIKKAEKASEPLDKRPVEIVVVTNWMNVADSENEGGNEADTAGTSIVDQRIEITAKRIKNVAFLKNSISKRLPGKPPAIGLELMYNGKVLDDDEMLLDEILEEDEDDEDEDEDEEKRKEKAKNDQSIMMHLNIVPPVDPKYGTDLEKRVASYGSSRLSTKDLIEGYFLNQVALSRNAALLSNPNMKQSSDDGSLRLQAIAEAERLKEAFLATKMVPEEEWEKNVVNEEATLAAKKGAQRRGRRVRKAGAGGATTNLRQELQYNFNINWIDTVKNFFLLLIFGYFGGRSSFSRAALMSLAPMCFVAQYRPVKLIFKRMFYLYFMYPPSVIKNLLPAPLQTIYTFDYERAYQDLYWTEADWKAAKEALEGEGIAGDIEDVSENAAEEHDEEEEEEFYDAEEYDEYDDEEE